MKSFQWGVILGLSLLLTYRAQAAGGDVSHLSDKQLMEAFKTEADAGKDRTATNSAYFEAMLRGKKGDILSALADICKTGTFKEQYEAIELYGDLGAKEGIQPMAELLRSLPAQNIFLLQSMTGSLLNIDGKESDDLMVYLYHHPDNSHIIHAQAIFGVAAKGQKQLIPELQNDFNGPNNFETKGPAALALAQLGDNTAHDWAKGVLTKDGPLDITNGYWAIATIGAIGDKADEPLIQQLIKEKETFQRYFQALTYASFLIKIHGVDHKTQVLYMAYSLHKLCDWMVDPCVQWLGNDGSDEAINQLKWAISEPTLESHWPNILKQLRRRNVNVEVYTDDKGKCHYRVPQGLSIQVKWN